MRDFYAAMREWPGSTDFKFGALRTFDTLDRGKAWDPFLHHLSELLISERRASREEGALAFGRSVSDFGSFHVRNRHHKAVADRAASIACEFDYAEEPIQQSTARRMAYHEGVGAPSAYDLIFLPNFLTTSNATKKFETQISELMRSLTPGGIIAVLGGTGGDYPTLYSHISELARSAKLRDISPTESFCANERPWALSIVRDHIRNNVDSILDGSTARERKRISSELPRDLVDSRIAFKLPKFTALIFVRQGVRRL
jgi:hypothetical protein